MTLRTFRLRRAPAVSALSLALLMALSMPAWAADPVCVDEDGNPTGANTDLGIEDGEGATGFNINCHQDASA